MRHPSLHRSQHSTVSVYVLSGGGVWLRRDRAEPRDHTMHGPEPFDPLGCHPISFVRNLRHEGAIFALQVLEEFSPVGGEVRGGSFQLRTENRDLRTALWHRYQGMQHILELIGVAHIRPRLLLYLRDGCRIERPNLFEYRRR